MSTMSRRQRLLATVASIGVTAVLAVGLSACAPPASPSSGAEGEGGTLRIAAPGSSKDALDPHFNSGSLIDLLRTSQLFDNLTELDPDSVLQYSLAESMESNETGDVWTIHLRPDVTFHDGSAFDSEDVISTIKRIIAPDSTAVAKSLISFIPTDGLVAVDDLTVEVTLTQPYGLFPDVWTNKYLRIVPSDFDPKDPVGTGPFSYKSFTAGQSSTFVRNDDYWAGAPKLDSLVITDFKDNDAAINALKGGQVDLAAAVPLGQAAELDAANGIGVLDSETNMYINIAMRTDQAPFDDVRVREAMRLIADREEIVDVALNGYGVVGNDYIGRYSICGDPDVPQREQDLDRAKELLAEAGQSDLTVDLATTNGTAGMVESAQVFAEQAKKAGVTVNVKNLDVAAYLETAPNWTMAVDFFTDTYPQLVSRTLLPSGSVNETHWNHAEFNGLADQMFQETDAEARCEIEKQMKTVEYNDGGNIIWGFADVLTAHSDKVHGLAPDSTGKAYERLNDVWVG
ncbi:ABC transporter substrate-binding protein [Microbacterium saperdae]